MSRTVSGGLGRLSAWLCALAVCTVVGSATAQGLSARPGEAGMGPSLSVTWLSADRFRYRMTMMLPTPCHRIGEAIVDEANAGDSGLTLRHRISQTGEICAQVLTEAAVEGEVTVPGGGTAPVLLEIRNLGDIPIFAVEIRRPV